MKIGKENLLTRRSLLKGATTLAGGLIAAYYGSSYASNSNPIRIGHQCDLTGALASTGYWRKKATDAAAKWLNKNKKGISGRPIEIITIDTQTKVDVGVLRMRQLIQNDKVDFIVGSEHGGINLASTSVAKEFGVPYLSMSRTDSVTGKKGLNPYVFRLMVDTSLSATATSKYLVESLGKKWNIFYADYVWGVSHRDAWTKSVKLDDGKVTNTVSMPVNTADPLRYIVKLDHSADGIYVALLGPDVVRSFSALRQLGFAGTQLVAADAIFGVADVLSLGQQAEGIRGLDSIPWELEDKDTPYIRTMRNAVGIDEHGRELGTNRACMMGDIWPSWENLGFLKTNIEGSGWESRKDTPSLIEYIESHPNYQENELFPQGPLYLRPSDHQAFCDYYILRINQGRIRVEERMQKDAGLYPPTVDIKARS